jgi:hypothetical protein
MMKSVYATMALFAAASTCYAQAELRPPIAALPTSATQAPPATPIDVGSPPCESMASPCTASTSAWWIDADYLLWWFRRSPLPTPLVTTGNPNDELPGALGQPGTRTLFGGSGLDYGAFSGGRLILGGWLDSEHTFGVEANGFLFEQRATNFAAASNSTGTPPLYIPVINQNPASPNFGHQSSFTIADPLFPGLGGTVGNVSVSSDSRLWGAELNGLVCIARRGSWTFDGLLGFRYVDLSEHLNISGFTDNRFDDIQQTFHDGFRTRNEFYGAQIGGHVSYSAELFTVEVIGKVALGSTHEVVDIQGSSFWAGSGFALPAGVFPGGVLTQPSNIGSRSADDFGVIPQVGVKLRLNLTQHLSASVGYDLLYWTNVVRPGNQIDHNLNATQFPGVGVQGPLLPAPLFNHTDFLAQGISFGLAIRY